MRKEYYRDWQENAGYEGYLGYCSAQSSGINEKAADVITEIISSVDKTLITVE